MSETYTLETMKGGEVLRVIFATYNEAWAAYEAARVDSRLSYAVRLVRNPKRGKAARVIHRNALAGSRA
jgi:hypothetical protein